MWGFSRINFPTKSKLWWKSVTFLLCSWLFLEFRKIIFVFRTKSLNASPFISQFSTTTAFIWDFICFFLWYFSNLRLLSWTTSFRSSCQLESLLASPTLNKFRNSIFSNKSIIRRPKNTTYTAHFHTTALGKISFQTYSMSRAFVPYFWEYAILKTNK